MSARKYLSYTYLIGWSKQDLWYYGVRTANKTEPENDLWIHYFTHGTLIPNTREKYGEPDIIIVDKTFIHKIEAYEYEYKVLKEHNVINSSHWLNLAISVSDSSLSWEGKKHTEEWKRERSIAMRGDKNPMYRKQFSKEHRRRMSESHKNKPSPHRKKIKINGVIYESITNAAKQYNVSRDIIYGWIKKGKVIYIEKSN